MTEQIDIRVNPEIAATPELLKDFVARQLRIAAERIKQIDMVRRSIDARQKKVMVNLRVSVHVDSIVPFEAPIVPDYRPVADDAPQAIVVGSGPAGLFAALALIENGVRPIVLERGKDVDSRRKDLARISRTDVVDPESNYAFGEGGAGTYSDGKLFTRSKKRGNVAKVLNILHKHGAPHSILVDAHPHIGTNLLPEIIKSIRHTIEDCGGLVFFNTKMTEFLFDEKRSEVVGVLTADGREFKGPVILATGHSARDVYRYMHKEDVSLEAKGIAVGVRLEHPSHLIDCLQYHSPEGRGRFLPAAEYSMLTRIDDRAVYSFCMCPGGIIVPAATGPDQQVVNGMSPSNRGSRWSNAGMVVEVLPDDIEGDNPLRIMHFQEKIEKDFFDESQGSQNAPAQRMRDFVTGVKSTDLPPTSYAPGIHTARMDMLLPKGIAYRLRKGFEVFGKKQPGFLTNKAVLIGAETRTSAPVRIPRQQEMLHHTTYQGLYPAGEGAGYAGGIVSAALDGDKCAFAIAQKLKEA